MEMEGRGIEGRQMDRWDGEGSVGREGKRGKRKDMVD